MKPSHILALTLALPPLLLIGCSSGQDAPPPPPQKTVFDSMTQTEQRARDVQKTVDENTARARKATEAQERGDAAP
jgi:uncharacterized protein YcfL